MGWDFETDPEFQSELDWVENFVREEIEPLDFIVKNPYDLTDPIRQEIIPPEAGPGSRPLGMPSRTRAWRARVRTGQAGTHERDSWARSFGLDDLWVPST